MKYLAALLLCLFAANAEARAFHGGAASGAAPTAPVLTPTTYTLGQQTQAFYGYVFLHAQDFTSPSYTPLTVSGLGLMSPSGPACDTWYMTYVSGRSSTDFQISASVADASAITPLVSFTGVGNLTGDYVFNIQCSKAGVFSNTVPLTVHTIANAANIGGSDNFSGGWAPNNFGITPGAKLLLSTGGDFHAVETKLRGVTLGSTNTNRLTITIADAGRMPYVSNFTTQDLSNIDVTGINATGNTDVAIGVSGLTIFGSIYSGTPTSNETWENLNYYGSMLMYASTGSNGNSVQAFFNTQCTTNCLVQNLKGDFITSGFAISAGLHAINIDLGHWSNDCTTFNTMDTATLENISCHDPLVPTGGLHVDCMQNNDGATGENITVKGFWCIQAGGMGETQGLWFGGFQLNGMGYIDDGTGAHGPGTILTLTSGSLNSSSYGSRIWSPGNITIAAGVRVLSANTSTGIPTSGLAATNIGSPGSPVPIANVGLYSAQMEGIVQVGDTYHGLDTVGESGTSFYNHFALVQQSPDPYPTLSFTGNVNGAVTGNASGTTITVSTVPTVSSLSVNPILLNTGLNYSGCPAPSANAFCSTANTSTGVPAGLSIGGEAYSLEPVQATGTATFSGATMTITGPCTGRWDYDIANGAQTGGLIPSGSGVPQYLYIIPTLGLPADGCAGTYTLNRDPGVIPGSIAVSGRPGQKTGVYGLFNYGTGATPTGSLAMTALQRVGIPPNSWAVYQANCTNNYNHQGTFDLKWGYSDGGFNLCGAPVTNTTTTSLVTPVAADFATGVLPGVSLSAITAATWDALDTGGGSVQKRALICNKMLPAVGHALDLGGGNFAGPFTATGELQIAGGNVAITGCGIH